MYIPSVLVILGCTICAIFCAWWYFRHYEMARPPIGVFNLKDIALMIFCIILIPFLYLVLPSWFAAGLLGLLTLSILAFTGEPLLPSARWIIWLGAGILLLLDIGVALVFGTRHNGFFAINNVVLIITIIGISNLWAQSGMKARDATVLAILLVVYDIIATSQLPLTNDVLTRLATVPFTPVIAWESGNRTLSIGLGDLLLATMFPLVMRKAFKREAGITALILSLGAIGTMLILPIQGLFPAMVVLGPLTPLQYLFWRRRFGQERTMWQYLQEEPI